jgi:hypothetical protein
MKRATLLVLGALWAVAATAQPRVGSEPSLPERLLSVGGSASTVRYVPGALDRAVHVTRRLDMIAEDLRKRVQGPYPLAAVVLGRPEWEAGGLSRPYGLPAALGTATVVVAVPAAGDDGSVRAWSQWLGTSLPPVSGVPMIGTASHASSLLLADIILQREACSIVVTNTLLVGREPWIHELMTHLAMYTLYARYEPSRLPSIELVFQRLRANLPVLLGLVDDRVLPAEKWLLQQAHFFEGARQLYEAGGQKALAQLWKKTRKAGGPLPRATLVAEYPVVGTWLAGIPPEVEIP